jgi:hypothetical protein
VPIYALDEWGLFHWTFIDIDRCPGAPIWRFQRSFSASNMARLMTKF